MRLDLMYNIIYTKLDRYEVANIELEELDDIIDFCMHFLTNN